MIRLRDRVLDGAAAAAHGGAAVAVPLTHAGVGLLRSGPC